MCSYGSCLLKCFIFKDLLYCYINSLKMYCAWISSVRMRDVTEESRTTVWASKKDVFIRNVQYKFPFRVHRDNHLSCWLFELVHFQMHIQEYPVWITQQYLMKVGMYHIIQLTVTHTKAKNVTGTEFWMRKMAIINASCKLIIFVQVLFLHAFVNFLLLFSIFN